MKSSSFTYEDVTGLGEHVPGDPPPRRGHDAGGEEVRVLARHAGVGVSCRLGVDPSVAKSGWETQIRQ